MSKVGRKRKVQAETMTLGGFHELLVKAGAVVDAPPTAIDLCRRDLAGYGICATLNGQHVPLSELFLTGQAMTETET